MRKRSNSVQMDEQACSIWDVDSMIGELGSGSGQHLNSDGILSHFQIKSSSMSSRRQSIPMISEEEKEHSNSDDSDEEL